MLNYHRIGDRTGEPWDRTLWNVTAEMFDAQMEILAREAEVIGPAELLELARRPRPGRRVLVTFDDGYRDNHDVAFPILRRHGLTAAFFPATAYIDGRLVPWWDELAWLVHRSPRQEIGAGELSPAPLPLGPEQDETVALLVERYKSLSADRTEEYLERVADATGTSRCRPQDCASQWMTWEQLRELHAAGMAVGGHTVTHPILARLGAAEQRREIAGAGERLREELGAPMRWFAYPVGSADSFTSETQRLLREQGVELAFSFHGGFADLTRWEPLAVPRVHVSPNHGPELLRAMLALPRLFTSW